MKRFYVRTNKIRAAFQIAQHTRRGEKLRLIKIRVDALRADMVKTKCHAATTEVGSRPTPPTPTPTPVPSLTPSTSPLCPQPAAPTTDGKQPTAPSTRGEQLPYCAPEARFHIADSQRDSDDLTAWAASHGADPALQVCLLYLNTCFPCRCMELICLRCQDFIPNLKNHILARLDPDTTSDNNCAAARSSLLLRNNRIYWHRVARINYTTYDRQRTQDSLNPRTHSDILLLAQDGPHPYLYARVLKILHVNARLVSAPSTASIDFLRVDVLWVRWYRLDHSHPSGFKAKRLPRLEFVPYDDEGECFGFVNPADVVRGAHIIPAFAHGRTATLLGPSVARDGAGAFPNADEDKDTDFAYHYVNL